MKFEPTQPGWADRISRLPLHSIERRWSQWPYYLPPYGWHIDHDHAPRSGADWTCAIPGDEHSYNQLLMELDRAEDIPLIPCPEFDPPSRSRRRRSFSEFADDSGDDYEDNHATMPSPFFARAASSDGRTDPRLAIYRFAQRLYPTEASNPIMHPAFQFHSALTRADIKWDVVHKPVPFQDVAHSARIPLFAEEWLTPMTHPPMVWMRIRLASMPAMSFIVKSTSSGGLTMQDVMSQIAAGLHGYLLVAEWNEMRGGERALVAKGFRKRTGRDFEAKYGLGNLAGDDDAETDFKVGDALYGNLRFLGLQPEEHDLHEWILHTRSSK